MYNGKQVMKFELRWSDIGHSTAVGRYPFRGSDIEILARHIYAWMQDPEGVWEVVGYLGSGGRARYGVRSFQPSPAFQARQAADPTLKLQQHNRIGKRSGNI